MRVAFSTPRMTSMTGFWLLALLVLAVLIAWSSAEAQEPPLQSIPQGEQEVKEESTCSPALQILFGLQLVNLQYNPESLMGTAVYYKKLTDGSIILMAYLRQDCESGWRRVKVEVIRPKRPCLSENGCL